MEFPHINPVALEIGPLQVHWYGLMYLLGFAAFLVLGKYRTRAAHSKITSPQVDDLLVAGVLGAILGGRVGYMLFYNFSGLLYDPISLFYIWEGGMSFHGGLLGVILAMLWFSKKQGLHFLDTADFSVPLIPIGIGAGRIGNFINGELWGRTSDVSWAVIFPNAGEHARHPSQLYEFALEGVVLFIILWWYARNPRPRGRVAALFLMLYALMRIGVEFFREPDAHIGFVALGWLTMGQILSLPLLLLGIWLWFGAGKRVAHNMI